MANSRDLCVKLPIIIVSNENKRPRGFGWCIVKGWKITLVYERFFGLCLGRYTTITVTVDCEKTHFGNPYQPWSEKGFCRWLIRSSYTHIQRKIGIRRLEPETHGFSGSNDKWWFHRLNFAGGCQPTGNFLSLGMNQIVATLGPKLRLFCFGSFRWHVIVCPFSTPISICLKCQVL